MNGIPIVIAHDGPVDETSLIRSIEAARRIHEVFGIVTRRFLPAKGDHMGDRLEWEPMKNTRLISQTIAGTGARLYAFKDRRGERSGIMIPQPSSKPSPLREITRRLKLGTSTGRRSEGRGYALVGADAVADALEVLEMARDHGVFDIPRARAIIAADAIGQNVGSRARNAEELCIVAPTPWTDCTIRNRTASKTTWDSSIQMSADSTSMVRAVLLNLSTDTPLFSPISSEPFAVEPTPMDVLRLHARASGSA